MTLKNIFIASTLSFIVSVSNSGEANALSLHEALNDAYSNNSSLNAERKNLESTNENLPQAYAGWFPTVSANYTRERQNESIGGAQENQLSPNTKTISISQPVFNGWGTLSSIKQAHNIIESGRARLQQAEQQVLSNAVVAYVNLVHAEEVLLLSKNNERVLEEQLEATNERFSLGETTRTDVAQSEARLAIAKSGRITAEGKLVSAKSQYKLVFETEVPDEINLPKKLPEIPNTFDIAENKALNKNPFLASAKFDDAAANDAIRISRASIFPTIHITGDISRRSSFSSFRGGEIESESVSLNVSIPIFQSGSEYSRIRQSKSAAKRAAFTLSNARNTTIDNVTKTWQDVKTTKARIEANTAAVSAATLALEGVKQEQEIGSRTTLDVLDAEQELFTAQVDLVTAKRDGVVSIYNLKASIGELTASSLGLDVEYYSPEKHYDKVKYKMFGY